MKEICILILLILTLACRSTHEGDRPIGTSLLGVLYDGRSNPVQNATLLIRNMKGQIIQTIKSDINGKFYLNELDFGDYRLEVKADRCIDTEVAINHYDIENVLIIRIKTFDDKVRELEKALKTEDYSLGKEHISELEKIDPTDIYFIYLKAIYLVKTDQLKSAKGVLQPYKNRNYPYIDKLLEDISE